MTVKDVRVASSVELLSDAAELRSGSEVRDDLISVAKHDLRNPISSIMAFADILLTHGPGNLTPRQRSQVERIKLSATAMNETLERAFFAINLESDCHEPLLETTDIRAVLADWVAEYKTSATATLIVRHNQRPAGPSFADVDRRLVYSALSAAADMVTESGNGDDDLEVALEASAGQRVISIMATGWGSAESGRRGGTVIQPHQHPLQSLSLDRFVVESAMDKHGGYVESYIDSMTCPRDRYHSLSRISE